MQHVDEGSRMMMGEVATMLDGYMICLYVYVVMLCAGEWCRRTWWDESVSRRVTHKVHCSPNTFEFHRSYLVDKTPHWSLDPHYGFSLLSIMHCLIFLTLSLPKVCIDRWTQIVSYNTTFNTNKVSNERTYCS